MDFKNELRNILQIIGSNKNYKELLNTAFELSFRLQKNNEEPTLVTVISEMFKINANILIEYICSFENFTKDDLNLEDNELLDFINEIKLKYGYFMRISRNRIRSPFGIKEIQGNVGQGFSHNILKIIRCDDKDITLSCNTQDLVNIATTVNQMLFNSISVGVYNLDLNSIKSLLSINKELNAKIEEIVNGINQ